MENRIEQTISSIEVAEMVEKEHKNLMRDVRSYMTELAELKIEPGDFFKESTYKDANNQSRPCYNVTKKGCEFIAHKLTGIKGTEFTARYINRFHDMEDMIREGVPQNKSFDLSDLSVELQAIIMHDKKIQRIENRMDKLEYDIPLYGSEADELCNHVKRKGMEKLGGKSSNSYKDTKIRSAVYTDIYNQIKREFGLYDEKGRYKSYKALKRKYIYQAHDVVDTYELPAYLDEQIRCCNAQVSMEVA